MSAVSDVVKAPKTVIGWAKSKTLVFVLLVLALVLLAVKYRAQLASWLGKIPVIGPHLVKFMTAVGIFLLASPAFAAHATGGDPSALGSWGHVLGLLAALGVGAALTFPTPYPMDLKSDGATQVSLTPGTAEVTSEFKIGGVKGHHQGAWMKAVGIGGRLRVGVDQPSSGSSVINWDQLFRIIAGLEISSPRFGTLLNKESSPGPVLKHLIEFVGLGYSYCDYARAQIAASDGDTAVDLYFYYPIAPRYLTRPHDAAPWVGWLDKTIVKFFLGTTTAIDAVSTGAVIEATSNLQMWMDYILDNDLEIPTLSYWQRYSRAAAGGSTITLEGVGAKKGLKGVEDFDRIAVLAQHCDVAGFGGPDGADNITRVYIPMLGLERLTNVDAIFAGYRAQCIRRPVHVGGNGTSALHDGAGNPETMAAAVNAVQNSATAMYVPLRMPSPDQEVTKLPKFYGDLEITEEFTSAPSSGSHVFTIGSIKQLDVSAKRDLLALAGIRGATATKRLADGSDYRAVVGSAPSQYNNRRRFAGIPDEIELPNV